MSFYGGRGGTRDGDMPTKVLEEEVRECVRVTLGSRGTFTVRGKRGAAWGRGRGWGSGRRQERAVGAGEREFGAGG